MPRAWAAMLADGAFLYVHVRDGHAGRTSTWREPQAEHFISRAKSGNDTSP